MVKNKEITQNKQKNNFYNVYAALMTSFVSAVTGFGFFSINQLINIYPVFFNIFLGMMISALMFNTIKKMYPYR